MNCRICGWYPDYLTHPTHATCSGCGAAVHGWPRYTGDPRFPYIRATKWWTDEPPGSERCSAKGRDHYVEGTP